MCCSDTQQFCCGFDWNYFHQRTWAKTVNIVLQSCELCVCLTHSEELLRRWHVYMKMWAKVWCQNGQSTARAFRKLAEPPALCSSRCALMSYNNRPIQPPPKKTLRIYTIHINDIFWFKVCSYVINTVTRFTILIWLIVQPYFWFLCCVIHVIQ